MNAGFFTALFGRARPRKVFLVCFGSHCHARDGPMASDSASLARRSLFSSGLPLVACSLGLCVLFLSTRGRFSWND